MITKKHYPGELAYFDSFTGLIPCKITGYDEPVYHSSGVEYAPAKLWGIVTANRPGGWYKGEILHDVAYNFIPRDSVHMRDGKYTIRDNYTWCKNGDK